MRDETRVASSVPIGDPTPEDPLDDGSLIVVQALRGHERYPNPNLVHRDALRRCMLGNTRQCRRVAEQHPGAGATDNLNVRFELRLRHLEGWQQPGTKQAVASATRPVLRAELDRRAPDDNLGIADIDVPPASRAPLGGDVVADPLLANVK